MVGVFLSFLEYVCKSLFLVVVSCGYLDFYGSQLLSDNSHRISFWSLTNKAAKQHSEKV